MVDLLEKKYSHFQILTSKDELFTVVIPNIIIFIETESSRNLYQSTQRMWKNLASCGINHYSHEVSIIIKIEDNGLFAEKKTIKICAEIIFQSIFML